MLKRIIGVVIAVILIVGGFVVYSVLKPPAEAEAPVTAIPIGLESSTATPAAAAQATGQSSAEAGGTQAADSGTVIYEIVPADSKVNFTIKEVLRGQPNTVVGTTDQVAGQIALDPSDPAGARIGTIQVDARTLVTDDDFRNRTIKNQILDTNSYEYITFTPRNLTGLPDQISFGTSYTFKIVGDLTIKEVTKEVSIDATVTPVDATRLQGSASATILYKDFGITIPQVRQVASVDDAVALEIDFVADAQ
ncbi:MAG TPA: YceI family protein [Anaerolineales bacterium]|nr:YceI family protein [Anaerolineales bacterium]